MKYWLRLATHARQDAIEAAGLGDSPCQCSRPPLYCHRHEQIGYDLPSIRKTTIRSREVAGT